jgi:hypothetical protein
MEFSNEQLLEMIKDKGLNITLVLDVIQGNFIQPYKYIPTNNIISEDEINLFNLKILSKKYMLLTNEEIKHIKKEGYLIE